VKSETTCTPDRLRMVPSTNKMPRAMQPNLTNYRKCIQILKEINPNAYGNAYNDKVQCGSCNKRGLGRPAADETGPGDQRLMEPGPTKTPKHPRLNYIKAKHHIVIFKVATTRWGSQQPGGSQQPAPQQKQTQHRREVPWKHFATEWSQSSMSVP
jgi:hypothetical protein